MHLYVKNVNHAFQKLVEMIHHGTLPTERRPSRNGEVLLIEEPMTITYGHPNERVLMNKARDANPFFHLYEALWMLAGRNDIAPLTYYNSKMANFSDDGKTQNGAYGYRWRKHRREVEDCGMNYVGDRTDQLDLLVTHLKADPWSRRAVLSMWNVEDDLLKIGQPDPGDWEPASKDVCCNLNVMFAVEQGVCKTCGGQGRVWESHGDGTGTPNAECGACNGKPHDVPRYLNMTVTNRSNDLVWGALGANVVHFSILQEYMAARLGLEMGRYHHFTNNLHVYADNWKPEEWTSREATVGDGAPYLWAPFVYPTTFPLVSDPAVFEEELPKFVEVNKDGSVSQFQRWREPFLDLVAQKMCHAFHAHKNRDYGVALGWVKEIAAEDWRLACDQWVAKRRKGNHERRANQEQKADV